MREEPIAIAPTSWVPADFLPRMEQAFGEPLTGVAFRRSPDVDRRFCGVAVTLGDEIWLGSGFFALCPRARELVLAHELVHVLQKRQCRRDARTRIGEADGRERLEIEAAYLAVEAVSGRRARCRLGDASALPSCWGPAGHYWTCLFVLLAVGVEAELAAELAFFCQMPDMVTEFDATAVIFSSRLNLHDRNITSAGVLYGPIWGYSPSMVPLSEVMQNPFAYYEFPFPGEVLIGERSDPITRIYDYYQDERIRQIQAGLHCLTGGKSDVETKFRTNILKEFATTIDDTKLSRVGFGLALHAFGDSYAHRDESDPSHMYGEFFGHLKHGHDPDDIESIKDGRKKLYHDYVHDLHGICFNFIPSKMRNKQYQVSPNSSSSNENWKAVEKILYNIDLTFKPDLFDTVCLYFSDEHAHEVHAAYLLLECSKSIRYLGDQLKFLYSPDEDESTVPWDIFVKSRLSMDFIGIPVRNQIDSRIFDQDPIFDYVIKCSHDWYMKSHA